MKHPAQRASRHSLDAVALLKSVYSFRAAPNAARVTRQDEAAIQAQPRVQVSDLGAAGTAPEQRSIDHGLQPAPVNPDESAFAFRTSRHRDRQLSEGLSPGSSRRVEACYKCQTYN